jgi:hypothetical protein
LFEVLCSAKEEVAKKQIVSIDGDHEPYAGLYQGMLLSTSAVGADTISVTHK